MVIFVWVVGLWFFQVLQFGVKTHCSNVEPFFQLDFHHLYQFELLKTELIWIVLSNKVFSAGRCAWFVLKMFSIGWRFHFVLQVLSNSPERSVGLVRSCGFSLFFLSLWLIIESFNNHSQLTIASLLILIQVLRVIIFCFWVVRCVIFLFLPLIITNAFVFASSLGFSSTHRVFCTQLVAFWVCHAGVVQGF